MANVDNVQINLSKTAGAKVATDSIDSIQYQRVKINYGEDGTAIDVSQFKPLPVDFDDPSHDAFGRHRVSQPLTEFEVQHQYNTQPLVWDETLVGGGTVTHLPNESSVRLRVTGASGDIVRRRTKRNFRYLPGKSQQILLTGVMGARKTSIVQRIGYFDDNDGVLFEQNASRLEVVVRTSTSGSVVNNSTEQDAWNVDKLDGTGVSGITIDTSKMQIFVIDFQWLGAGRVRFGFEIKGKFIPCHEALHSNISSSVYMKTANLPVTYEIETTGTSPTTTDLIQTCSAVISEGGLEREGFPFSANNGTSVIAVTTRRAVLSIRRSTTFNSIANTGLVIPKDFKVFSTAESVFFEIVLGATLGGSPSWGAVDADSLVEYDVAGTTVSGGKVVASGYLPAASQGQRTQSGVGEGILSKLAITNSNSLTLVVTSINGSTTDVVGSFDWNEVY
jgi:hypothetical protein